MELKEAREKISAIDTEMAELFKERMEAVRKVAEYKSERGLPIEDRERELALIESKSALIDDEELKSLYISFLQKTMDISKNWQHKLIKGIRVACAEENFADGEPAANCIFPEGNITAYEKFEEAYKAAEDGSCDVAVLPLENSDRGEAGKVYDMIFSGNLFVNSIRSIERDGSTTRYAVLSRMKNEEAIESDTEAFLIMFTVKDEVGGLAKAINIISAYSYNMRVLRSRPMRDLPWHYYFYAELTGKTVLGSEERILRALNAACPIAKIAGHFVEEDEVSAVGAGE